MAKSTSRPTPESVPPRHHARFGRVTKAALVIFIGGALVRWVGWPLWQEMEHRRALVALEQVYNHIGVGAWKEASECLKTASRGLPPDDVNFLRALAAFLDKAQVDPVLLRSTLLRLKELGHWQNGDSLSLAWTTYHSGNLLAAANAFDLLPAEMKSSKEGRRLAVALAESQGFPPPVWAESEVEKLIRIQTSGMTEMQGSAVHRLWELARGETAESLHAIAYLASMKTLSTTEARILVKLAENHPAESLHERLAAYSGLMRASPDSRRKTLAGLVDLCRSGSRDDLRVFVEWLALEGESDVIRTLLTKDTLFTDAALFTAFAQSLIFSGHWQELRLLLTEAVYLPPVSTGRVQLWLAEVASHEDPGGTAVENHLKTCLELESTGNQRTLLAAGKLAEKLNLNDLALDAYDKLAQSNQSRPLVFIERAAELAATQGMTDRLVGYMRSLCKLRPESQAYRLRLRYLERLQGMNLEFIPPEKGGMPEVEAQIRLIQALAAYRMQDALRLKDLLIEVKTRETYLTHGQKAVLAGMLAADGQVASGFQLAEKLQRSLLLPEEQRFLDMAL